MSDFWGSSDLAKGFLRDTHERQERISEAKRDAFAAYNRLSRDEKLAVDGLFKSGRDRK